MNRTRRYSFPLLLTLIMSANVQAGVIIFDDRDAFELAIESSITTDYFVDAEFEDFDISSGNRGLYSGSSLNSDDTTDAIAVHERATLTIDFNFDVFAIGFDVNELNSSHLNYIDNAGHEVINALMITEVWNESTFFGLISDTAINSFSLVGSGTSNALYGFDSFSYVDEAITVTEPSTLLLFILSLMLIAQLKYQRYRRS